MAGAMMSMTPNQIRMQISIEAPKTKKGQPREAVALVSAAFVRACLFIGTNRMHCQFAASGGYEGGCA